MVSYLLFPGTAAEIAADLQHNAEFNKCKTMCLLYPVIANLLPMICEFIPMKTVMHCPVAMNALY